MLSSLGVALTSYVRAHVSLATRMNLRVKTYYLASAGVKHALVMVATDDSEDAAAEETEPEDATEDLPPVDREEFKEIELGDGTYSIFSRDPDVALASSQEDDSDSTAYGLTDEEGKININQASLEVLTRLFEIAGDTKEHVAAEMAAAIVDWRDDDDDPQEASGAENFYYSGLSPAYECKNRPFDLVEEMLLVKGIDSSTFEKVKDYVTVYGAGGVNVNSAAGIVLQSLGMDDDLAETIIRVRNGNDGVQGTDDDQPFESVNAIASVLRSETGMTDEQDKQIDRKLLTTRSEHFSCWVLGQLRDSSDWTKIRVVFNRSREIKYWREW